MVRNYLGFFWALCLALSPAWAAEVLVGDLSLSYAPPWERGLATEEEAENSAILRWQGDGAPMTVFLPHQQVELKVEASRFYRQLEQSWRALYGADARVYPLEMAGTKWRVCRRPSLERDATVFQLVTVHEGRAQHLVLIAPGRLETLPDAVERLAASAAWGGARSVVLTDHSREALVLQQAPPMTVPAAPAPVLPDTAIAIPAEPARPVAVADRPQPQAAPAPAATTAPEVAAAGRPPVPVEPPAAVVAPEPVKLEPAPAKPAPGETWRLARVVHALPRGARLAALAEAEAPRFGEGGMLTGFALSPAGQGIKGFLEGYVWEDLAGKRLKRKTVSRHWQLGLQAPAEIRLGDQNWRVSLVENRFEPPNPETAALGLRLELLALCGPRAEVVASLDALEKDKPRAAERLAGLARACPATGSGAPAASLALATGGGVEQSALLALPAAWVVPVPGGGDVVKRLVVAARFPPSGPTPSLGDGLLTEAAVYYVYVPQEGLK